MTVIPTDTVYGFKVEYSNLAMPSLLHTPSSFAVASVLKAAFCEKDAMTTMTTTTRGRQPSSSLLPPPPSSSSPSPSSSSSSLPRLPPQRLDSASPSSSRIRSLSPPDSTCYTPIIIIFFPCSGSVSSTKASRCKHAPSHRTARTLSPSRRLIKEEEQQLQEQPITPSMNRKIHLYATTSDPDSGESANLSLKDVPQPISPSSPPLAELEVDTVDISEMYRLDTNTPSTRLPQPHSAGDPTFRTISPSAFPVTASNLPTTHNNPHHHLIQQTINPSPHPLFPSPHQVHLPQLSPDLHTMTEHTDEEHQTSPLTSNPSPFHVLLASLFPLNLALRAYG
ncbi:hypothetical protein BC829DRAFT_449410 [Chytridium lagenaria]|nr:hypothetical protein BC829DRAFT_449410 [Chytridium lagenaria]